MNFIGTMVSALRGGAQAANAAKIIAQITGQFPDADTIGRMKAQAAKGIWRSEHNLALLFLRYECTDLKLGEEILKRSNPAVRLNVIAYYERCREKGVLSDYIIDEYEAIKQAS